MLPKLSIVIVTWNVRPSLERCLCSIDKHADMPFELFVIDNYSTDDTRLFLEKYEPENRLLTHYRVIYNNRDVGYAKGVNMGLRNIKSEYALLLNPDTQILNPSFGKMFRIIESVENLGMIGFKIIKPGGKLQWSISRLPSVHRQIESRLGLWKPRFDYDKSAEVEQINAAVILIPKKVLDTVGLWDEGFFLWFEENDFCIRARAAGYKIYYSPEVSVLHESQAGISKMPFWERQIIWQRSMFRYFRKHHGLAQAIAISILDPLAMFAGIIMKKIQKKLF